MYGRGVDSPVMVKNVVVTAYTEEDIADFGGTLPVRPSRTMSTPSPLGLKATQASPTITVLSIHYFPNGGKVTFSVTIPDGGSDTNVRFVFEKRLGLMWIQTSAQLTFR